MPIVEPNAAQKDKRKGKQLQWKKAKTCLAHAKGSMTLAYGGRLQGDVAQAGRQLFHGATVAGFASNSRLHAVGNGTDWIATQVMQALRPHLEPASLDDDDATVHFTNGPTRAQSWRAPSRS